MGGCAKRAVVPEGPMSAADAAKRGERMRMAWVSWPDIDAMLYCTRRLDDYALQVGMPGPCWRHPAGGEATRIFSWFSLSRPDSSSPLRSVADRCHVELEEAVTTPEPAPARAYWVTPTERVLIEEWMPERETPGDRFLIELSFSPESKWMAVLHVAVDVGDGERIVRVDASAVRPIPACK